MGLEPLVFCAHASKRYEMRSPSVDGPTYNFPKQNEANPQNQYRSRQSCEYEHHCKKLLHHEEIHFEPVRPAFLLQFGGSCGAITNAIARRNVRGLSLFCVFQFGRPIRECPAPDALHEISASGTNLSSVLGKLPAAAKRPTSLSSSRRPCECSAAAERVSFSCQRCPC